MRTDCCNKMNRTAVLLGMVLTLMAGCGAGAGGSTVVKGTGSDELLKLRAGPGLGYKVILGLPDGTALMRRECVTELGQSWCKVSLANAPAISGFVSEDYLSSP